MKQFKLKSRAVYDQLVEEEYQLTNEMELWAAKFEQYTQEKSPVQDLLIAVKKNQTSNNVARSNSVGNRLY
jgi:N-glycosylase/DNA lyase